VLSIARHPMNSRQEARNTEKKKDPREKGMKVLTVY